LTSLAKKILAAAASDGNTPSSSVPTASVEEAKDWIKGWRAKTSGATAPSNAPEAADNVAEARAWIQHWRAKSSAGCSDASVPAPAATDKDTANVNA